MGDGSVRASIRQGAPRGGGDGLICRHSVLWIFCFTLLLCNHLGCVSACLLPEGTRLLLVPYISIYLIVSKIVSPSHGGAFNALLAGADFHPHSLSATIVVLHKEGKDPQQCSSYRPISLLNNDLKIFAAVLAGRLSTVLPLLLRKDQVGFIPAREARDGTIRTLNMIHTARSSGTPMLLLSTDAEKAFDRVSWPFMFSTLRAMNIPAGFIRWIAALYCAPNAKVRVNGVFSESFQIQNGTRQGCPLSPLLFALTLEPFLESVRNNTKIPGLRGQHYTTQGVGLCRRPSFLCNGTT
uniref:Reverse transcriptase domain-containing protein n=1 Tax=Leptobrachium leishanense TaxID=445787 RepID=A0A8C5MFX8_9ANUR